MTSPATQQPGPRRRPGRPLRCRPLSSPPVRLARSGAGRSSWRVLGRQDFAFYFTGSLVSNLGTWLHNTAQVLLTYRLTHSVLAVGLVTGAQFSGSLLLGPWAAVVADRLGGRRMLFGTQLVSAAIASALAVLQGSGLLNEGTLIAGALGLGLMFTFALPVQTALVPRLVPDSEIEAAMAMNSVSYNLGRAVAPALCVLVVLNIGFAPAFALNAASFVFFAATLAMARPLRQATAARPARDRPARARASDGMRAALQQRRILLLLAMVAAVTFADDPVLILGPAVAHRLGAGPGWAGYFLSALGCGTVLGSLRPAKDTNSPSSKRAARSLLLLVAAIAVFAVGISAWVSLLAAFIAGMAALWTGAVTQTQLVRQRAESTASVMALWAIAWAGTKPVASLSDGWLASHHGIVWAALALGMPALGLGLVEAFLPRRLKQRLKSLLTGARVTGTHWRASALAAPALVSVGPAGTAVTADAGGADPAGVIQRCAIELRDVPGHCPAPDQGLSSTSRIGCAIPAGHAARPPIPPALACTNGAVQETTTPVAGNRREPRRRKIAKG